MMDRQIIEQHARKMQTTRDNIAREYCQHLFLSRYYQQETAEKVLFKGGTALRILWHSPRFSEDLDFSGVKMTQSEMENTIEATLIEVAREGINVDIQESKKTTGGYLGKLLFQWANLSISIQIEVSYRKSLLRSEQALVQNDFVPAYVIFHLSEEVMIQEKISALVERSKPRDYFDLYFILRSRGNFYPVFRKDKTLKKKVLEKLHKIKDPSLLKELKQFLPASHHSLLRNFPSLLEKELQRALPK